jgi:hypothetical protein
LDYSDHKEFEYQRAGALHLKLLIPSKEDLATIVGWARQKGPNGIARFVRRNGFLIHEFDQIRLLGISKAARWLAMVRRDHEDKFELVVNELLDLSKVPAPRGVGPKVGQLEDGTPVYDRADGSHRKPEVTDGMLEAALAVVKNPGVVQRRYTEEVDFGFIIGVTTCVEVTKSDEFVFAQRGTRKWLTRFVKNRQPEKTRFLTVTLEYVEGGFILITAYIGRKIGPEPGDTKYATAETNERWLKHALVWGYETDVGPETTDAPWYYQ